MKVRKLMVKGIGIFCFFLIWTLLICKVDVKPIGINNSNIGFSTLNLWFHNLTGSNLTIYTITDWAGLIPVAVCLIFAVLGLSQLIKRRSIIKVDLDIILLGVYYIIVIASYLIFEMYPINYRPIFINGFAEASYPSSTTLLVLSVMPTLELQTSFRIKNKILNGVIACFSRWFSVAMVMGRLLSGVHWLTDIIGSLLLSIGLFLVYKAFFAAVKKGENNGI